MKKPGDVLRALCDTVEATGGITYGRDGNPEPVGDPDWIDLGVVYLAACEILSRKPMEAEQEEER